MASKYRETEIIILFFVCSPEAVANPKAFRVFKEYISLFFAPGYSVGLLVDPAMSASVSIADLLSRLQQSY